MTMEWVDSHCHLTWTSFDDDRPQVIARARAAGVTRMVTIGVDVESSRRCVALAHDHAGVYAAVGIHPNDLGERTADFLEQPVGFETAGFLEKPAVWAEVMEALAADPAVVAIGEIGLDYYWERVPHPVQQAAFEAQLALAARLGKPVIIHDRDAHADVMNTLRAWVNAPATRQSRLADRRFWGVLHSFSGDLAQAREALTWPFLLSFAGPVTFKNARALHTLVTQLPLDRLLLETDAPFLTPHPWRGQRNEPARVALVGEAVARLLDRPLAEVAGQTTATAREFFAWSLP